MRLNDCLRDQSHKTKFVWFAKCEHFKQTIRTEPIKTVKGRIFDNQIRQNNFFEYFIEKNETTFWVASVVRKTIYLIREEYPRPAISFEEATKIGPIKLRVNIVQWLAN